MPPKRERKPSAPPDSRSPQSNELPDDLRRDDRQAAAGEEIPSPDEDAERDDAVDVHSPAIDGGIDQHPIHDDDPDDDFTPEDYEEQIDESDKDERGRRRRTRAGQR